MGGMWCLRGWMGSRWKSIRDSVLFVLVMVQRLVKRVGCVGVRNKAKSPKEMVEK